VYDFGPFVSAAKFPFPRTETLTDRDPVRVCGAIIAQEGRTSDVVGTIPPASRESDMVFPNVKGDESHGDRVAASAQQKIRLTGDGNALQPEAASSISSGLSIVGKIIGQGPLTIFGSVEGNLRRSRQSRRVPHAALASGIQELNLNSQDAREIGSILGKLDELCRD
jgi:hypothetical protein